MQGCRQSLKYFGTGLPGHEARSRYFWLAAFEIADLCTTLPQALPSLFGLRQIRILLQRRRDQFLSGNLVSSL
jgi:hypothetical protein